MPDDVTIQTGPPITVDPGTGRDLLSLSGEALYSDLLSTQEQSNSFPGEELVYVAPTPPVVITDKIWVDLSLIAQSGGTNENTWVTAKPIPIDDLGLTEFRYVVSSINSQDCYLIAQYYDPASADEFYDFGAGYYMFVPGDPTLGDHYCPTYITNWLTLPAGTLAAEPVLRVDCFLASGGFVDVSIVVTLQFRNGYAWASSPDASASGWTIGNSPIDRSSHLPP